MKRLTHDEVARSATNKVLVTQSLLIDFKPRKARYKMVEASLNKLPLPKKKNVFLKKIKDMFKWR